MTVRVNTNLLSLNSQRMLGLSTNTLHDIQQRLATGKRIHSAADDAAGLAIATKIETQTKVYTQAVRNLNDGVSALNIFDGALQSLNAIVSRQSELAEQAANGAYTLKQRQALNKEFIELVKEYNRIVASTEFNGFQLLNNSEQQMAIQAGISGDEFIETDFGADRNRTVGDGTYQAASTLSVGASPNSVISRDFNGDGFSDIATADEGSDTVTVRLSDGSGGFLGADTYATGVRPNSLHAEDINQDGHIDLVAADYGYEGLGDTLSIFLGVGDGTFQTRSIIPTSIGPTALDIGDIDGDGIADIVHASHTANFLSGLPETARLSTDYIGRYERTRVTMPNASATEQTLIRTIAASDSVAESSQIITDAIASRESTQLTFEAGSSINSGNFFTLDAPGNAHYVWFNVDGAGGDPLIAGRTGVAVSVSSGDTSDQIAAQVELALAGISDYSTIRAGSTLTVTNTTGGSVTDATSGAAAQASRLTMFNGASIGTGNYFSLDSPTNAHYVWYNVDGAGGDPLIAGRTGVEVAINSSDTATSVANKTAIALSLLADYSATNTGANLIITNSAVGDVPDPVDAGVSSNISVLTEGKNDPLSALTVISNGTSSAIDNGDYFTLNAPGTDYYVWFDIDNTGSDPTIPGKSGIEIDVTWSESATSVANKIRTALNGVGDFLTGGSGATLTVTNLTDGSVADITNGSISGAPFATSVTTQGVDNSFVSGDYFLLSSSIDDYYVWLNIDGAGGDPGVAGRTGIEVALNSSDDSVTVANKITMALSSLAELNISTSGINITVTDTNPGPVTNASDVNIGGAFVVSTSRDGSLSIIENNDYFTLDTQGTNYYVWFNYEGTGSDPLVPGRTGIEVALNYNDSRYTVAQKVVNVVGAHPDFTAFRSGDRAYISNAQVGPVNNSTAGNIAGLNIVTDIQGEDVELISGQHMEISTPTNDYYLWYNLDGAGGDPAPPGKIGIEVALSSGDTRNEVATKTKAALDALGNVFVTTISAGFRVDISAYDHGEAIDVVNVDLPSGFSLAQTQDGEATYVNIYNDTFTVSEHKFNTGKRVQLTTDGTLPSPLTTGVDYFIIAVDTDTIQFATSQANALAGIAIDITTYGLGTHSIVPGGEAAGAGVSIGLGDGTFELPELFAAGQEPNFFKLIDVNADGKLDLLTAEGTAEALEVQLGDGQGNLLGPSVFSVDHNPFSIATGDFDFNGTVDAALVGTGSNNINILSGNNDGTFQTPDLLNNSAEAMSIVAGDLNGDGLTDLVTADFDAGAGSNAGIYFGTIDGTFTNGGKIAMGAGVRSTTLADLNNDGVLDIITANSTDNSVSYAIANTVEVTTQKYMNIATQAGARAALDRLQDYRDGLTRQMARVGAVQSRFAEALEMLPVLRENLSGAMSRILDADIAEESAQLIRIEILQQAATSILAQANQQPSLALKLLQG